jgi:hypothetical protein
MVTYRGRYSSKARIPNKLTIYELKIELPSLDRNEWKVKIRKIYQHSKKKLYKLMEINKFFTHTSSLKMVSTVSITNRNITADKWYSQ